VAGEVAQALLPVVTESTEGEFQRQMANGKIQMVTRAEIGK
jgi:hypothetical protein